MTCPHCGWSKPGDGILVPRCPSLSCAHKRIAALEAERTDWHVARIKDAAENAALRAEVERLRDGLEQVRHLTKWHLSDPTGQAREAREVAVATLDHQGRQPPAPVESQGAGICECRGIRGPLCAFCKGSAEQYPPPAQGEAAVAKEAGCYCYANGHTTCHCY
jgi:hypothetical protein